MRIQRLSKNGFTLVEIMIVVAIVGLLATIAIPNFLRARTTSQQKTCISNLRQIDGAVQQWALENSATATNQVTVSDIENYIGRSTNSVETIVCPAAGKGTDFEASYKVTRVDEPPKCLIGADFALSHSVR